MHPRLEKLNKEMAVDRSKTRDYLNAVHNEHTIRVNVFTNAGRGFVASAKINGYVHRYTASTPAQAFLDLTHGLKYVIQQMNANTNAVQYSNQPNMTYAATAKQLGMIRDLSGKAGIDAATECKKAFNCVLKALDKRKASDLIDALKQRLDQLEYAQ